MVESQPSKLLVAGSIPVSRSIRLRSPKASNDAMSRRSAEGAKGNNLRSRTAPDRELRLASLPSRSDEGRLVGCSVYSER